MQHNINWIVEFKLVPIDKMIAQSKILKHITRINQSSNDRKKLNSKFSMCVCVCVWIQKRLLWGNWTLKQGPLLRTPKMNYFVFLFSQKLNHWKFDKIYFSRRVIGNFLCQWLVVAWKMGIWYSVYSKACTQMIPVLFFPKFLFITQKQPSVCDIFCTCLVYCTLYIYTFCTEWEIGSICCKTNDILPTNQPSMFV